MEQVRERGKAREGERNRLREEEGWPRWWLRAAMMVAVGVGGGREVEWREKVGLEWGFQPPKAEFIVSGRGIFA